MLPGGQEARDALEGWLDEYGARCVGEIDITRPRWSEHPSALVPVLLGHVRNFEPGAAARRFEQGRGEAGGEGAEVLERLRRLPDGAEKAAGTSADDQQRANLHRVPGVPEVRDDPPLRRLQAGADGEAERLVARAAPARRGRHPLPAFEELRDVVGAGNVDDGIIRRRQEAFRSYEKIAAAARDHVGRRDASPGRYRRDDAPPGALVGLPVSAGVVEGGGRA